MKMANQAKSPAGAAGLRRKIHVMSMLLTLFAFGGQEARSDEAADLKIAPSVIKIKVTGTKASGLATDKPAETSATGLVVSVDGFVLTNYHIVTELGDVIPGKINFIGTVGDKDYDLTAVNAINELDLLLLKLKAKAPGEKFVPAELGNADFIGADEPLSTYGCAAIDDRICEPKKRTGAIASKSDPVAGYVWRVNFDVQPGQSGSPVYDSKGIVVGIAKGDNKAEIGTSYMIPIQYADPLIAHIRLAAMQKEIAALSEKLDKMEKEKVLPTEAGLKIAEENLKEIGSNFAWAASFAASDVSVTYQKLVNTGPAVEKIIVTTTPISVADNKGRALAGGSYSLLDDAGEPQFIKPSVYDLKTRRGSVTAHELLSNLKLGLCATTAASAKKIEVKIEPFLDDGRVLEALTVLMEYPIERKTDCNVRNGS